MYGLNNKAVSYLLEQFDSVQYCKLYKNKYVPKKTENEVSYETRLFWMEPGLDLTQR